MEQPLIMDGRIQVPASSVQQVCDVNVDASAWSVHHVHYKQLMQLLMRPVTCPLVDRCTHLSEELHCCIVIDERGQLAIPHCLCPISC